MYQSPPQYRKYYGNDVIVPYIGFRFLKFNNDNHRYENYIVTRIIDSKTAETQHITFEGKSIGDEYEIIRLENINKKRHAWIFRSEKGKSVDYKFGNRYPVIILGIANNEGIIVKSPDDPSINYKLTTQSENNIIIPEINLIGRIIYFFTDYPYVVTSFPPLTMKYIGENLDQHDVQGVLQGTNWVISAVNNPKYNEMVGLSIEFGKIGFEYWNPPT